MMGMVRCPLGVAAVAERVALLVMLLHLRWLDGPVGPSSRNKSEQNEPKQNKTKQNEKRNETKGVKIKKQKPLGEKKVPTSSHHIGGSIGKRNGARDEEKRKTVGGAKRSRRRRRRRQPGERRN